MRNTLGTVSLYILCVYIQVFWALSFPFFNSSLVHSSVHSLISMGEREYSFYVW